MVCIPFLFASFCFSFAFLELFGLFCFYFAIVLFLFLSLFRFFRYLETFLLFCCYFAIVLFFVVTFSFLFCRYLEIFLLLQFLCAFHSYLTGHLSYAVPITLCRLRLLPQCCKCHICHFCFAMPLINEVRSYRLTLHRDVRMPMHRQKYYNL